MNISHKIFLLATIALLLSLVPLVAQANPADYNATDTAAMINIASSIGLPALDPDPVNWPAGLVDWDLSVPKRLTTLNLSNIGGLSGTLNTSGLTELQTLYCGETNITTLIVNGNLQLRYISCEGTGITVLDVSNNLQLSSLSCGRTGITTLNVSNNSQLQTLFCDNIAISSLNVSNNLQLWSLYCGSTSITSIDVSKNTQLRNLACVDTAISSLDVSNNTLLQYLYCHGTGITTLDVSSNPQLHTLLCGGTGISALDVRNNPQLEVLSCYATFITNLDVSQNPVLTVLHCTDSRIASLNLNGCMYLLNGSPFMSPSQLAMTGNPLTTLFTPDGHEIQVSHVGDGIAYIDNYLLTPRTVHLYAIPDSGWTFDRWNTLLPVGLSMAPDVTYTNGISFVASQQSHIQAIFNVRAASAPPPRTGDNFPMAAFALLLGMFLAGIMGLGFVTRRKREKRV